MAVILLRYNEMKALFRIRNGFLEWKNQNKRGPAPKPTVKWYRSVRVNNKSYLVHRITYCLKTRKDLPQNVVVDHKDGDKNNNHVSNLRRSTPVQNCWNQKLSSNNKTGVKGLCLTNYHGTVKYMAQIRYNKKRNMQRFPVTSSGLKEAKSWLITQRILLHGDYARFK